MKDIHIELDDCPSSPSELLWRLAEAQKQIDRLKNEIEALRLENKTGDLQSDREDRRVIKTTEIILTPSEIKTILVVLMLIAVFAAVECF